MNPNRMRAQAADVLAGEGQTITLVDGREIRIQLKMSSIRALEKEFGSLGRFYRNLGWSGSLDEDSEDTVAETAVDSPFFSTVSFAIWACTTRKMPLDQFVDLLDPARMEEYVEAFGEAYVEAFGGGDQGEAAAADEAAPGPTTI